jgi:hypothetical protein
MKVKIAEIYPVEYWLSSTLNIKSHSLLQRKYGPRLSERSAGEHHVVK